MICHTTFSSPLGSLLAVAEDDRITAIHLDGRLRGESGMPANAEDGDVLGALRIQLDRYWAGEPVVFDVPLQPRGTAFQMRVWDVMSTIPYGETITYGELARRLGQPAAVRAVGRASGANPLPIVIPCHRVIGSTGSLVGYAGGLDQKRTLLALEDALPEPQVQHRARSRVGQV